MADATQPLNTPERPGLITRLLLAASALIYQGVLVAVNSAGNAVKASDTAGLRVMGMALDTADNTDGAAGDLGVDVKQGIFLFDNSAGAAVDADDVGKLCYVEDDHTVAESSTHKVIAGRVVEVESRGVWVDTRYAQRVPSADTLTALTFSATVTAAEADALRDAVLAILQAQNLVK
jgi:hypothetical protein